jgi:phospholipid/cholesterol/gamma-HCH transport system substrate-binding protein
MARRLAWSNVRGGLIAIGAIVGVSIATLKYARVGALHGDTIRVYALVGEARGVLKGSEVWLLGQKIGKVTDIEFRNPTASDTSSRLVLSMELLDRYRIAMHRDAMAEIKPGGSVIGAVVVYLSSGTASAPLIRDQDSIRARPQADVEAATAEFGAAAKELPAIAANVKTLRAELQTTRGSVGALINTGITERGPLQSTGTQMARLRRRLTGDRGSMGRMMSESEGIGARAQRVMARADSVRALVGSSGGSLGRFRRDSTLLAAVTDIRNELASVQASLAESRGTTGRVLHDSAAFSALGEARREMTLLVADLKKHPLRYNPF